MHLNEVIPKNSIMGDPVAIHGLGIIPLITENASDIPELDLLEPALKGSSLKITEVSDGGAVPFLRAENSGSKPVLILDGEELVGGKQNRIVNTSVIILPGKVMDIPVSCMEAGRWNRRREDFTSGEALFRAKSRAVQKASIASNLKRDGSFRSDQGAVWNEVSFSLKEMQAPSATSDFREGRAKVAQQIETFVEAISSIDDQIGVIFLSRRGILGLELVATADLFGRCLRKIIRSFAFEVLLDDDLSDVSRELAEAWWNKLQKAPFSKHSSPGAGEDIRVEAGHLIGSGLLWNDALVHFSCFPVNGACKESGRSETRRASAGERRRQSSNR